MKTKFPFEHIVDHKNKKVWIKCSSCITAIGIPTLIKSYYSGYTGHIADELYFNELKGQLKN
jgi:hypothetical protein